MNARLDHILLTRFNLPTVGAESVVRSRDGWLRERIALFERYTVPSVQAQTLRDIVWLVYIDPASPRWLLDRLEPLEAAGLLRLVRREAVPATSLLEDLRAVSSGTADRLLTTNVDNDDALAVDFVERVQAAAPRTGRAAVYLTQGLIGSPAGLFLRHDRHNAFCSVAESWDDPVTAWADWHNRLHLSMPVVEVSGPPGWLQVVHGGNVSNRTRGRRVSPQTYRGRFGMRLDRWPDVGGSALVLDRLVWGPLRAVREVVRAAGKAVALRLLGKDGLDTAKSRLAQLRR